MKKRLLTMLRTSVCASALALSLMPAAAADYSSTLSGLSPLAYWKLNEGPQPAIPTHPMNNLGTGGAALNGTYYGAPTLGVPGALTGDTAVSLNGSWQYAEAPYNAALNPTGPFTVEFWAYLTNDTAGAKSGPVSRYITVAGGPTAQLGYLFFVNNANTSWQFRVYNGASATTITDNTTDIAANTWYHVVGVYDGANIHIYLNGVPTSTATGTVVYKPNTNAPARIGAGTTEAAPTLFFPGTLDNVAVYHSVLSADKIAAHYDAALTNAAGYNAQVLADSPAAYYPLNETGLAPFVPHVAVNSGTLGSALNGAYYPLNTTSGVAEPLAGQFAGFAPNNKSAAFMNGRVDFPPVTGMNTDHATITCWVKRNGAQVDTTPMFFHQTASGSAAGLNFYQSSGNLAYHWEDSITTHWSWNSGLVVPNDVWTFVALVVTPTNGVMYLGSTNGLVSRTNVSSHAVHDFSLDPGMLARVPTRTDRYLKGGLDEVALFDRPLDFGTVSNLFYSATPAIPLVTRTPANPVFEGMTVTFVAYPVSTIPVTYQWRRYGTNLPGKTAKTLVLNNATAPDSGDYDVVVTAGALSVTSTVSPITVSVSAPLIVQQPASATRYEGGAVTFSVGVQGSVPYTYQWKKGTTDIPGATGPTYTIPVVAAGNAGTYNVTVINPLGSSNSANATLTVLPTTGYATSVMRDGAAPLVYYRLNEKTGTTAYDYASGQDATINNSTANDITNNAPGPVPSPTSTPAFPGLESTNTAYRFGGDNSIVKTPGSIGLNTNNVTITAFVNWDGSMKGDLMWIANLGGGKGFHVDGSGNLRYHWDGNWGWSSGLVLPVGQWAYVALVVEETKATIYMDDGYGNGLRSAVHGGSHPNSGFGTFGIGSDPSNWGWRPFRGAIDEVAVYNRALSPGEIANAHLVVSTGTPSFPIIVSQPKSRTVIAGTPVSFSVSAYGAIPLTSMTYKWKHAGIEIPGATGPTLSIPSAYYTDAGTYQAVVTSPAGTTNSDLATLVVEAPSSFANLTNDLVLHLRFDGDYGDSSGRTNHATPMGSPAFVAGRIGNQAVQLNSDKTNSIYNYVQLLDTNTTAPYPDLLFTEVDSFSVAFWVKYSNVEGDLPIIGNVMNSTYNTGWVFSENFGGRLVWTAHGSVGGGAVDADGIGPVIKDGTWHHVVTAFDRLQNTAVTYIDGAEVDARSIEGLGSLDSGYALYLGQDPSTTYGYFGSYTIDDLGIWRRALTPSQATGIYAAAQVGQSFDVTGPAVLTMKKSGSNVELIWQQGTLQSVNNLGETWVNVPGAVAPFHVVPANVGSKYYRVKF